MKKIYLLVCSLFVLGACEYETVQPEVIDIPDDVTVSFAATVEPAFQSKCVTCHNTQTPVLSTGQAYNSLKNGGYINTTTPTQSKVYLNAQSGHYNSLSATDAAYLLKWIEQGAKNN